MTGRILRAVAIATAAVLLAAGTAGAVVPANGGDVTGPIVTVSNAPGIQSDPRVSGNLVAYTDAGTFLERVHYYDFATGVDRVVPSGDIDSLPSVSGSRIAFARQSIATGQRAVVIYDVATDSSVVINPPTPYTAFATAIAGDTVAFLENTVGNGDIALADVSAPTAALHYVSSSPAFDGNSQLAPNGNIVVWEACNSSFTNCDVLRAVRTGGVWGPAEPVSDTAGVESNADTDGVTIVYDSDRPSATGQDIYFQPVGGGVETPLSLPGIQRYPRISEGVISFESKETSTAPADLFVYVIATNTLFRVTNLPTVDEALADLSVMPNGDVRVVWMANDGPIGEWNIYARTFTVPLVPAVYAFGGFFSPLDNPPVFNVAKGGQAIPVKFSLDGNQGLDIFAAGYPMSQQIACDPLATLDVVEETVTAGSSSLSYDATTDQYSYAWKTNKAWAKTCRQLIVRLSDGTDHIAYFSLK